MKAKRVFAFLFDILLVTLIATMMSQVDFLNPRITMYQEVLEEYTNVLSSMSLGSATTADTLLAIMYKIEYSSLFVYLYYLIISFLYFVVFQYFTSATLGKKIMKLEIVNKSGKKATFIDLAKRYLFGGLNYFTGVHIVLMVKVLLIVSIGSLSASFLPFLGLLGLSLDIANIIMLFKNKDARTLADMIAGTKVILKKQ